MSWIAVGVAGGSALLKAGEGLIQNHQAAGIEKNNPFPSYSIPKQYQENVNTAENMSREGTPLASYNKQESDIQRNQAGALTTVGRSANPGGNIASIVRAGNDATGTLNAQDAIQRNRNMLTLLQERQTLGQQLDKQWDWNVQQKYLGNLAKSQALRTSGNANISGALSDVQGTATTAGKLGLFGSSGRGQNITGGYQDDSPVEPGQSTVS